MFGIAVGRGGGDTVVAVAGGGGGGYRGSVADNADDDVGLLDNRTYLGLAFYLTRTLPRVLRNTEYYRIDTAPAYLRLATRGYTLTCVLFVLFVVVVLLLLQLLLC